MAHSAEEEVALRFVCYHRSNLTRSPENTNKGLSFMGTRSRCERKLVWKFSPSLQYGSVCSIVYSCELIGSPNVPANVKIVAYMSIKSEPNRIDLFFYWCPDLFRIRWFLAPQNTGIIWTSWCKSFNNKITDRDLMKTEIKFPGSGTTTDWQARNFYS